METSFLWNLFLTPKVGSEEKCRIIFDEEIRLENQRRRKKKDLTYGILLGLFL